MKWKCLTAMLLMVTPLAGLGEDFVPSRFALVHVAGDEPEEVTPPLMSQLTVDLSTDKACYRPGEQVRLTASEMPADARVRYRHGGRVIADMEAQGTDSWTWTPPEDDYRGYMVEVYRRAPGNVEVILGTIAVDVSTDWVRFPRYGFVATFDASKTAAGVIEKEMEYLNRCHINGVQFQDWHYKHHRPLAGTREKPWAVWQDIAWRDIYGSAVRKYIDCQHGYGMKSIFYNLCYGATDGADADGVDETWYIYRDAGRQNKDFHDLPENWRSDIYLTDPANGAWQQYMASRNDDVYANFDFDGYQIDQLGYRGNLYDYYGNQVDLPEGMSLFIGAMKEAHPMKRLVMNAVSGYGGDGIVATGNVDFAYNETWGSESLFSDLRDIIAANDAAAAPRGGIRTVFASYMNYDLAGRSPEGGVMNTPGVLLTDAVIMALGGAHLELGDHMLSREYFPASPLAMTDELRTAMIRYYDFMTAYENLLRDGSTADEVASGVAYQGDRGLKFCNWPPRRGWVTCYGRRSGGRKVCHLINFTGANSLSWRDLEGDMPEPQELEQIPVKVKVDGGAPVRVWAASPDYHGGAVQLLDFTFDGGYVSLTVPALKYWTMIVIEQDENED